MRKKGFSIIELLVALSIMSLVLAYFLKATIKHLQIYNSEYKNVTEKIYIDEGFNFIDFKLEREQESKVIGKCIKIKRADGKGFDWIRKDKRGDVIISYGAKNSSNTNNIVKNIKDFYPYESGEVIYITIVDKKGVVHERCLKKKE